jgi:hypothetical protein
MNVLRSLLVVSVMSVALASACGGGSKKAGDGGSGGASGSGSGIKMCAPDNNTCTAAESKAYSDCVTTACDTQYKECLGPNYKSGSYSGACGTYVNCFNACPCNDTTCLLGCGLPDAACQACLASFQTCSGTCTEPACYSTGGTGTGGRSGGGSGGSSGGGTGGSSGGGATCADLLACCDASTNATAKAICMMQYENIKNAGDATCAMYLPQLKAAMVCP